MKKKFAVVAATLLAGIALVSCGGGGGGGGVAGVATNTSINANATALSAVSGETFTFANAPAELGVNGTTTLSFTAASDKPGFKLTNGGNTASGNTTFGSCIFNVTSSTFPAGSKLAVGASIEIAPCEISLATANMPANTTQTVSTTMVLGSATSGAVSSTVTVNPVTGQLSVNGQVVGTVTVQPITGS